MGLGCTEATKCATRNIVGIDGIGIDSEMRYFVGTRHKKSDIFDDFYAGRGISSTIGDGFGFDGNNLSVASGSPATVHLDRMALMMTNHRLFATPDDSHR